MGFCTWSYCPSGCRFIGYPPQCSSVVYRKTRQVVACHLTLQADKVFDGSVGFDESYFGGLRKGKQDCESSG
nr:hypothetical protein [Neisseria iguanae]